MTLLDRFRTQARDKHPDPAVRLAYVEELPLDDREAIGAMAREDQDPRVRRAAVAKLLDPSVLGAVARADADEAVRVQAAAMLRDIALDAFDGVAEAEGVAAVDAVADVKTLAEIARAATREMVAIRALSRLTDVHMLGSVARHAASEAARLGALTALRERGERSELMAVALNSEFKDTALAAVDLFTERSDLEFISSRGKNKSAVKRARGLVRDDDEQKAADARRAEEQADAARALDLADQAARLHAGETLAAVVASAAGRETGPDGGAELVVVEVTEGAGVLGTPTGTADAEAELAAERARDEQARAVAREREAERRAGEAEREMARREAEAERSRKAAAVLHQLLDRVEPLVTNSDLSLKAAERALRDVRAALVAVLPTPEIARRLKAAQAALIPKLQELRDADEWRRWANVGVQEQLVAKMEALRALADPEAIAREVRELQEKWREVADAPRAQAETLWHRFKAAHDEAWAQCQAHFAAVAEARAANLASKLALCEQAEALAESSDWIQTAETLKRLQAKWKAVGPVPGGREKTTWDRFRAACDRFFTRRHADLAKLKATWAENLAKKEALCSQAEALAESTDWDATAAAFKRLQSEWKTVGPVKKSRSEAIWQRFRGACDRFFGRYADRHTVARAERVAAREAICTALETAALPLPAEAEAGSTDSTKELGDAPPPGLLAAVRDLRSRWHQELAAQGVEADRARTLDARYRAAVARVIERWPTVFAGTDLDPDANRQRMETAVKRVEDLATSLGGPAAAASDAALSPTTRLASMLKEALATNTIGGKADQEARVRAAVEDVRQLEDLWSRIGPVPDDVRRPLAARFERACGHIKQRAAARPSGSVRPNGPGRTGPPPGARRT